MATVAPIELLAQTDQRVSSADSRSGGVFSLLLALLAFLIHGYHPYAEDGGLYLAGVEQRLNPALFPKWSDFILAPTHHSLFAPAIALLTRATHLPPTAALPWLVLALHLATLWATLFAAWLITGEIHNPRPSRAGAVLLFACWLSLPVAGTALLLMDPYLTARSVSTPLVLFALVAVLRGSAYVRADQKRRMRNFLLAAACLVAAACMHPLMASYGLGCCTLLVLFRLPLRDTTTRRGVLALALSCLLLAACLQLASPAVSRDYLEIARTRTYWFLAWWSWYEWLGLIAPVVLLASSLRLRRNIPRERAALLQAAIATAILSALVAILFARPGHPQSLVARLQPLRALQFTYIVLCLELGAAIGSLLVRRPRWQWGAAALLCGAPLFAGARAAYPNSPHLELPWKTSPNHWVEAFLWIRDHTPPDALFALPAEYIQAPGEDAQCFRAIAQRSALPDRAKDGGEASVAPQLTKAWTIGQVAQARLNEESDTDRRRALIPVGVSWLILDRKATTAFICPYRNASVMVCQLPVSLP